MLWNQSIKGVLTDSTHPGMNGPPQLKKTWMKSWPFDRSYCFKLETCSMSSRDDLISWYQDERIGRSSRHIWILIPEVWQEGLRTDGADVANLFWTSTTWDNDIRSDLLPLLNYSSLWFILGICHSQGRQRRPKAISLCGWQWLYGQGPARATTRFINAVKDPLNGRLIKADLEAFNGYEARIGYGAELAVPFPYISMLYRMLTYIGVDYEYFGECQILSADMASSGWLLWSSTNAHK